MSVPFFLISCFPNHFELFHYTHCQAKAQQKTGIVSTIFNQILIFLFKSTPFPTFIKYDILSC
jgi:hypothetical protein